MTNGHGGNLRELARRAGLPVEGILDFSASINPLGPPECLRPVVSRALDRIVNYPDPAAAELVDAIAARYRVPADRIIVGNGSTEILHAVVRALGGSRAVIPVPTYSDYAAAARLAGLEVETLDLAEDAGFAVDWTAIGARLRGQDIVFLGQPSNPTGLLFANAEFRAFAAFFPAATFVVDEAFADFVEGYDSLIGDCPPNVIVLRSLTKFYAIPGLRLGFAVARPMLAQRIREFVPNWSVNSLAQAVGIAALVDADYARRSVAFVAEQRELLAAELAGLPGLYVYPGRANFLLVRLNRADATAATLADRLIRDGIAIRTFGPGERLDGRFFRVAVRAKEENARLLAGLAAGLGVPRPAAVRQRAAAIMFQGTSSNAGKSILTAALCRILLADGVRVAPFKSQNMSLNSFVTSDGGEMGRAQVVQAQASRLEPDVRMNPILLKPNSDTGSQVIVRGRPVGNMRVGEYFRYKPTAFAAARECYDSLAAEFDAIVLEGAGSPGEVNLKSHDIVNMRMAQYAGAPVLVVGDIDRGGVFASFVGTMEVLAGWEREMVAGWVVNRFRGDVSLLAPALDYTLRHTGRQVLGVVPFLANLNIPQEDSVDFKDRGASGRSSSPHDNADAVRIAVIDLPHISNFTDLDAFAAEPDVRVQIVRSADELDSPDAVIIPGSKNTLGDLAYLRRSGIASKLACLFAESDCQIVGICGGFQMLGRRISDPHAIESADGRADGLGLLDVETVLAADKTLARGSALHEPSGLTVSGYEIHHGRTRPGAPGPGTARLAMETGIARFTGEDTTAQLAEGVTPILTRADGQTVGVADRAGRVWGTYLHGIFDADEFRRWFIDGLRVRRGLPPIGRVAVRFDIEPALDRLAGVVRQSLNMAEVYRLLKL